MAARKTRTGWLDKALSMAGLQRALPSTPRSGGQRTFHAAEINRLTVNEYATLLSANDEIKNDLARLRGLSRRISRDTALGARFPRLVAEQTLGADGIRLQSRVEKRVGGLNRGVNGRLEDGWRTWGEAGTCTVDGRFSWLDVQYSVAENLAIDGEVLVRHVRGFPNAFGYAIEMLDIDLLDERFNGTWSNGNRVVMGVEVDRWHRPVAYHLWKEHPNSSTGRYQERERVLAKDIEHLFLVRRAQQTRGIPWSAPILLDASTLGAFLEAAVHAARVGASRMAAVERDKDAQVDEDFEPTPIPDEVAPAQILDLEPGARLNAPNWQYPNGEIDPFTRVLTRHVATGWNTSYASLSGDLSDANYGSQRYGLLFEREAWKRVQRLMISKLCWPVYRAWREMAVIAQQIPARANMADYDNVLWQPRGWPWIDPLKDMQAQTTALENKLTTRRRILAEQGLDLEEVLEGLQEEELIMKELGLIATPAAPSTQPDPQDDVADAEDDTTAPAPRPGGRTPVRRIA